MANAQWRRNKFPDLFKRGGGVNYSKVLPFKVEILIYSGHFLGFAPYEKRIFAGAPTNACYKSYEQPKIKPSLINLLHPEKLRSAIVQ